jgi:hypothetical protein
MSANKKSIGFISVAILFTSVIGFPLKASADCPEIEVNDAFRTEDGGVFFVKNPDGTVTRHSFAPCTTIKFDSNNPEFQNPEVIEGNVTSTTVTESQAARESYLDDKFSQEYGYPSRVFGEQGFPQPVEPQTVEPQLIEPQTIEVQPIE